MQEAIDRGFTTLQDFYKYRCELKRKLRVNGIAFDKNETTKELEVKNEMPKL